MTGREARDYWDDWGLVLLWTSMLAGPAAFGLNLQVGYALVKWACSRDQEYVLVLVAVVTLAIAAAGTFIGWTCFMKVRDLANEEGGSIVDRSYFMATVAIGLNLLLALVILTSGVSPFVLSRCE